MTDVLTFTEAAVATGKSRATIRRYFDAGRFPHAFRDESDPSSPWQVPADDLLSAGLSLASETVTPNADDIPPDMAALRTQLAVAQALADERALTIQLLTGQLSELQSTLRAAVVR